MKNQSKQNSAGDRVGPDEAVEPHRLSSGMFNQQNQAYQSGHTQQPDDGSVDELPGSAAQDERPQKIKLLLE